MLWLEATCFCSSPKVEKDELSEACYVLLSFDPENLHLKLKKSVSISIGYICMKIELKLTQSTPFCYWQSSKYLFLTIFLWLHELEFVGFYQITLRGKCFDLVAGESYELHAFYILFYHQ